MRHRFAAHTMGHPHHQFSLVMQRILRQTELMMQRRLSAAGANAEVEHPSLEGLEVTESTWDEWADAVNHRDDSLSR